MSLTLGPDEGLRVLREADADRDGAVSAAESEAYLTAWGQGLAAELPASIDGEPVALAWGDGYLDPLGPVRRAPVTVEMVARAPLAGGVQTLAFEDRMVRREVFDRTDVAFRARDGAELLASGIGADPGEPVLDLSYGPGFEAGAPVRLTAVARTAARDASGPWPIVAGLGLLVGLGLGVAWVVRRRARA